jgi:hypothetical protein
MKKGKKKEQKSKAKQRDLERLILSVREKEKEPKKRVLESGIGNKKPRFLSLSLLIFRKLASTVSQILLSVPNQIFNREVQSAEKQLRKRYFRSAKTL